MQQLALYQQSLSADAHPPTQEEGAECLRWISSSVLLPLSQFMGMNEGGWDGAASQATPTSAALSLF